MESNIRQEVQKCFNLYEHVQKEKESVDIILSGLEANIQKLRVDKEHAYAAWEALRLLLEKFSAESIGMLNEMLNKGVKAIFNDRDYSIEIEITDHKQKQMRLYLIETRNGEKIKAQIPEGIGGGILVVISFIFQIYLIRLYNVRPFILLDESFSQLSQSYLSNFMEFLRYLIEEMGFAFLWVTHDQRILPYFDRIYDVNMGKAILKS